MVDAVAGQKRKVDSISGGSNNDIAMRKDLRAEDGSHVLHRPVTFITGADGSDTFNEQYLRYFYCMSLIATHQPLNCMLAYGGLGLQLEFSLSSRCFGGSHMAMVRVDIFPYWPHHAACWLTSAGLQIPTL
jgi:hypothetical protein